jgi:uncharacterized protein
MPDTPQLTDEEVRVLGAMVEKSQATPAYYPMTINAIMNACNQKSSRDPVVDYSEDTVDYALEKLREKGLAATHSGTGRVLKHGHRIGRDGLGCTPAQAAALSILMLRGPQTVGEIKTRSGRQFTFPSTEFVQEILESMMTEEKNYIVEAPRQPGQKEVRYRHVFSPFTEPEIAAPTAQTGPSSIGSEIEELKTEMEGLRAEANLLRDRVASLESAMEKIRQDLYN